MARGFFSQKRHRAREMALQLLYALDLRKVQTPDQVFALFTESVDLEVDAEIVEYARLLTHGAWERRADIDNLIREHVVGWRPERMVAVDRAALRMCIFESLFAKSVPAAVAISESVELAKTFGTEASGKFVNGVMGKIVRDISRDAVEESGEGVQQDEAEGGVVPPEPEGE